MSSNSPSLSHFHGGIKLPGHKAMSTGSEILRAKLPEQLILPLQQHIGIAARPLVSIGDHVLKGQMLAQACGDISAPIHAPTSGQITDIKEYPVPHPSGLNALCIVLDSNGEERWCERHPLKYANTESPEKLRQRVYQAGIVGLGGAAFPTAVKLNPKPSPKFSQTLNGEEHAHIDTLIINGAECEPYISCDDMLMREYAAELISGCELIQYIVSARECLIAIEDNKPEAIKALRKVIEENSLHTINVIEIPAIYPTGGEKQLIKVITQKEVPSDGLPSDIGVLMQNVATAVAVHNAIHLGEPLISRIVTVTGEGIKQPQNIHVLIGTPMAELVAQSGGYHENASKLIMGGPMMGFCLPTDELPVTRACNCLLVENIAVQSPETLPCIRCGACAEVCPAQLLPQQLFWHASSKNFDAVQDYHLFDCIECGCCAHVCPSQIPLVQYYRYAKTEIWNQERERIKSDHARIRHDARQARLESEKLAREEKLRKKKELLEKKKQKEAAEKQTGDAASNAASNATSNAETDPKKAAIDAAIKRVQEKKAAQKAAAQTPHQTSREKS